MQMSALTTKIQALGMTAYAGYPATGAQLPYVVHRPSLALPDNEALAGNAIDWDNQHYIYCAAASVEACYNMAIDLTNALQGSRLGDDMLSASIGYIGAPVEGHYETQITLQTYQGVLS